MELRYVSLQCNLSKPATTVNAQNNESHYPKLARCLITEVQCITTNKNLREERERTAPELLSEVTQADVDTFE
jgi:hypothetical protein